MNKDFRISTCFWDHPKTIKLKRSIGYEGIESLQRLWSFAAKNKPTGVFLNMDADDIEIACKWDGDAGLFISEAIRLKWLVFKDDIYALHDWESWNGYAAKAEERSRIARRNAEKRWNNANSTASGMQAALQNDADGNAPSPDPVPSPTPEPSISFYGVADNVILSDKEYEKLTAKMGDKTRDDYIDRLSTYDKIGKYKSHYGTILKWWNKDGKPVSRSQKQSSSYDNPEVMERLKRSLANE